MILGLLVGVAPPAGATTFTPGGGSGSGWCAAYGGTNQASYDNVYACSPNTGSAGATPFDETTGFQCVELANRFLWDAYSDEPIFGSNLNGWNFAQTVHADYPSVPLDTNGTSGEPYLPGDIVSFVGNSGTPVAGLGHVAVVTSSSENSAGNGSIRVMQENATPYSQSLTISNWSLQMPSGSWVTPYQFDAFASSSSPPTPTPYTAVFDSGSTGLAQCTVNSSGFYGCSSSGWGVVPGSAITSSVLSNGAEVAVFDSGGNTGLAQCSVTATGFDGCSSSGWGVVPGTSITSSILPDGDDVAVFDSGSTGLAQCTVNSSGFYGCSSSGWGVVPGSAITSSVLSNGAEVAVSDSGGNTGLAQCTVTATGFDGCSSSGWGVVPGPRSHPASCPTEMTWLFSTRAAQAWPSARSTPAAFTVAAVAAGGWCLAVLSRRACCPTEPRSQFSTRAATVAWPSAR